MAPPSLWLYRLLIHAALPVAIPSLIVSDRMKAKRRPAFWPRLRGAASAPADLWIHAVSVGEVELAKALFGAIHAHSPTTRILVTSTTATGLALAERSFEGRAAVQACPLDLPIATGRVFHDSQPRALVLIETELWPEMLYQAGRRNTPVVIVNARLSERSFARYRSLGTIVQSLLSPVSLVLARDRDDQRRFEALGIPGNRVEIGGNLKYDLSVDERPLEWEHRVRELAGERPVIVAGSTMEGEEGCILNAMHSLRKRGVDAFLILAPRHPERFDAAADMLEKSGLCPIRRSTFTSPRAGCSAFLLDTIGELARAYKLGRVAFIGGSLSTTGGHNPLEALIWSVPVVSGPHTFNFAEIYAEMTAKDAVRTVADSDELAAALADLIINPSQALQVGERGQKTIVGNQGASALAARRVLELSGIVNAT